MGGDGSTNNRVTCGRSLPILQGTHWKPLIGIEYNGAARFMARDEV